MANHTSSGLIASGAPHSDTRKISELENAIKLILENKGLCIYGRELDEIDHKFLNSTDDVYKAWKKGFQDGSAQAFHDCVVICERALKAIGE